MRAPHHVARDVAGSVVVEYALALLLCGLGAIVALAAAGGMLWRLFLVQRALLLLPFP